MTKIIVRVLGIAGILFALYSAYLLITVPVTGCEEAERYGKEADEVYQSYRAAKAKGTQDYELSALQLKILETSNTAIKYQEICAGSRASGRFALIIGSVSGALGLALFISSFYMGRKRAVAYPPVPTPS